MPGAMRPATRRSARPWRFAVPALAFAALVGSGECSTPLRGGSTAVAFRDRRHAPLQGHVGTAPGAFIGRQATGQDPDVESLPALNEVSSYAAPLPGCANEVAIIDPAGGSAANTQDPQAYRKALLRTVLVILSAVAFGVGTMVVKGRQSGLEFFAGYLVEQSLSVDNLFVFIMLFEYFKVPPEFQGRVLTWGIIGAISMRAVMIVVGVAAIQRFRSVVLLFSGILLVSAYKLITEKEDHGDELQDNFVLKLGRMLVRSTDKYDGEKFFTVADGAKRATPLLLCLVCIELSDFVFAVDSIPAVLGVSKDLFIVYTSNVFAIMGLRSLYTLVSHAVTDLPYLKPAVAVVLGFVGVKMALEYFHHEIGIGASLSFVAVVLTAGTALSIVENKRRAAAGLTAASH